MFSSWQVRCGIADYTAHLVDALNRLGDIRVSVVPFDRQPHPRSDYRRWGERMNDGDVAHVQHEYSFFGYLTPWHNHFDAFVKRIVRPLVITRHVSFDGPLTVPGRGMRHALWQVKWSLYNRWLGPYARYLNREIFDVARQIIVLSARLKDHLIARGIAATKIHVIPPGLPEVSPASRDEAQALRAAWGWQDKRIVCQFGYIAPAKGHALALEALARLPEDAVLVIAGGARLDAHRPFVEALQQRITQAGLQSRVRIAGYLSAHDVARHLAASDVLIYPNTHADFSYSLLSGLAHRAAPAIASDIYAHREVAAECGGVALFRSGDAQHLAGEIERVTRDSALRRSMLEDIERYAQTHSWLHIAQRTAEVYRRAMESNAALLAAHALN